MNVQRLSEEMMPWAASAIQLMERKSVIWQSDIRNAEAWFMHRRASGSPVHIKQAKIKTILWLARVVTKLGHGAVRIVCEDRKVQEEAERMVEVEGSMAL